MVDNRFGWNNCTSDLFVSVSVCVCTPSAHQSDVFGPERLEERAGVCLHCNDYLFQSPAPTHQSHAIPPTSASGRVRHWPLKSRMGLSNPQPFTGATQLQLLTEQNGLIQIVRVCLGECGMFTARISFLLQHFLWNADRAGGHLVDNHRVFAILRNSWKVFKWLIGSMHLTDVQSERSHLS